MIKDNNNNDMTVESNNRKPTKEKPIKIGIPNIFYFFLKNVSDRMSTYTYMIHEYIHTYVRIYMHVYIRERGKFSTFLQKGIALLRKTEGLKRERGRKSG